MRFRLGMVAFVSASFVLSGCSLPALPEGRKTNLPVTDSQVIKAELRRPTEEFFPAEPIIQVAAKQPAPMVSLGFQLQQTAETVVSGQAGNAEKDVGPPEVLPLPIGKAPAKALSLDHVIGLCLQADPKLRAGFELVNQARADFTTSGLLPNPQLYSDIQMLPLTRPFTLQQQGGPPQMDFILSYPIDWFVCGKRAAAMLSAQAGVLASESDYFDLVRQRVMQAAIAFYDLAEAKVLLRLASQELHDITELEQISKKAAKNGKKPAMEKSLLRLALVQREQTVRDAEAAARIAEARLRSLLGNAAGESVLEVHGNLDGPLMPDPPSVRDAFDLAVRNRPDIESLHRQLKKAEADVAVEKRNAYPQISAQAGFTRQFQKNIGFRDANSWLVAVSTELPVFDRNQGNIVKAQSILSQRSAQLDAKMVQLSAEIEKAVVELQAARNKALTKEPVVLSAQVVDQIRKSYQNGDAGMSDLLDAQSDFFDAYRSYISARCNYWRSLYQFYGAVGQVPSADSAQDEEAWTHH